MHRQLEALNGLELEFDSLDDILESESFMELYNDLEEAYSLPRDAYLKETLKDYHW